MSDSEEKLENTDLFQVSLVSDEPVGRFSINLLESKSKPSFAWKHFGYLMYDGGGGLEKRRVAENKVFCNCCLRDAKLHDEIRPITECNVKCYGETVATSNLVRHLKSNHGIVEHKLEGIPALQFLPIKSGKRRRGRPPKTILTASECLAIPKTDGSIELSDINNCNSPSSMTNESTETENAEAIVYIEAASPSPQLPNSRDAHSYASSNINERLLPDTSSTSSIKNRLSSLHRCIVELDQEQRIQSNTIKRKAEREEELHTWKMQKEKEAIAHQREEHEAKLRLIKAQIQYWQQKKNGFV